jgi:hypothetical protein
MGRTRPGSAICGSRAVAVSPTLAHTCSTSPSGVWASPRCSDLQSRLFANGRRLTPPLDQVEDYAALDIDLDSGAHVNVTCSWNLHAGCDVVIGARFFGTEGAFACYATSTAPISTLSSSE